MARSPSASAARLAALLALFALVFSGCGQSGGAAAPTAASAPGATLAASDGQTAGDLVFLSNQFKPVEEAERMRTVILAQFPGTVEFIPEDPGPFNDRIRAEAQGGQRTIGLIGGLHGDLAPLAQEGLLEDLTPLMDRLKARGFPGAFVELSRLGTDKHYYIPWMQATYVLAVNKQALPYLPQGVDQNALTYAQLREWGANIQQATGERKLGFPGGPKGLMHRFFQGYLYPSYTGSSGVSGFKTPEATAMWGEFQQLWAQANPQSTNYEFMQEPLLSGEVWVAWDHVARLINAPKERPDDFVLLPAPAGPQGRGFMPVVAGLAIPKGSPNRAAAEQLIDYLTLPEQQIATLRENAFFPVVEAELPEDLPPGIRLQAQAVQTQSAAADARPSLLPIGLGAKGGEFNKVYLDTFQRIVLNGEPAEAVLQQQGTTLQQIMNETKAGCWPPDPPSEGPCLVR
ncbi:MAG TPA: ABC transporter substrate-binding protein [Roseiflexaceae bacterium]|nr:ABC transporter substrate-binding protein [Roseiflexaceae bacterium]